ALSLPVVFPTTADPGGSARRPGVRHVTPRTGPPRGHRPRTRTRRQCHRQARQTAAFQPGQSRQAFAKTADRLAGIRPRSAAHERSVVCKLIHVAAARDLNGTVCSSKTPPSHRTSELPLRPPPRKNQKEHAKCPPSSGCLIKGVSTGPFPLASGWPDSHTRGL